MFPNTLGLILVSITFLFAAGKQQHAVLAAQHQWIDAYNRRDDKALAGIESDDFRIVFGDGRVQNKADQMINVLKALPNGATYQIAVETTEVRLFSKTAVLTGIVIEKGLLPDEQGVKQPFSQRSRYTDVWIMQR